MITKESLQEKYAQMDVQDLLEISSNKDNYTELAYEVAREELKKRYVPPDVISNYKSVLKYNLSEQDKAKYFIDLNISQRLACFFIFLPRFRYFFNKDFILQGFALKAQQNNYYWVAGICFFIIAVYSGGNFGDYFFLYVWIAGFIISYLFDIGFNRQRQIDVLNKKISDNKNPFDF